MLDPTDGGKIMPAGAEPLLAKGEKPGYGSVQH
jgi:hypothetical protein